MSVKSKHSTSKKDRNGNKEKKKKVDESDDEIESSEEELDLTKVCHPIGYYINDREEMINQMFSVIKGNKLKAMLPPILKDYDLQQLKLQCLDQLLGMSEKRITCILDGETLDTSSESDVAESDEYESDGNEKNGTSSGSSDRSEGLHSYTNSEQKSKKRKGCSVNGGRASKVTKTNSESAPPEEGKTLLEILELEMRARAIRALLKQSSIEQGNDESKVEETSKNGMKDAGEIVDLTGCEDDELPVKVKTENLKETNFDKKVQNFEEKIEKSKLEKNSATIEEKSKRLQAELELRNKLFKKKTYRTRHQRKEGEENKSTEEFDLENQKENDVMIIKQEPEDPDEIVVEDPEEGEISTSEDEYPVEIKQEVIEHEEFQPVMDSNLLSEYKIVKETDEAEHSEIDAQLLNAVTFNENSQELEQKSELTSSEKMESVKLDKINEVQQNETENIVEETSWRDRWLKKDGVQKLVKSSKIYAKVKKIIAQKAQKAKEEVQPQCKTAANATPALNVEVVEGSIEEYERLLGKTQEQKKNEETSENGNSL